jgi:hypothetical protein
MTKISEAELDKIREQQEVFMTSLVTVKRRKYLADNEFTPETIATKVNARITPGFGFWREVADRFQGITAYSLTFHWNQDIQAGDVIVDTSDRVFEVRDVRSPSTYHTARQALADRISEDG